MMKKLLFFNTFFLIFSAQKIQPQTCCSGGVPLSNNIGLPFLEKGEIQLGFSYDYNNLNTLKEGSVNLEDNSRLRLTNSLLFNFSYNISNKFMIEGLLSWVNQKREIVRNDNTNVDKTSGLGDGVLLFRYMFLNKKKYSLSLGVGGKIPIGSSEEVNKSGILLNADLQPGSNAFDAVITSTFILNQDFRPSMNLLVRTTYRKTGTNSSYQNNNNYKFGNEFQIFFGVSDSFLFLNKIINPSVTIKYRNALADNLNDNKVPNTGGDWYFLNPNISLMLNSKITFITRAEIPLYSNLAGTQLTPTYRINTGLSIQFSIKKKIN